MAHHKIRKKKKLRYRPPARPAAPYRGELHAWIYGNVRRKWGVVGHLVGQYVVYIGGSLRPKINVVPTQDVTSKRVYRSRNLLSFFCHFFFHKSMNLVFGV